jgi:hypothetical protein
MASARAKARKQHNPATQRRAAGRAVVALGIESRQPEAVCARTMQPDGYDRPRSYGSSMPNWRIWAGVALLAAFGGGTYASVSASNGAKQEARHAKGAAEDAKSVPKKGTAVITN